MWELLRAVPHLPSGGRRASGGEWCPGSTAEPATPHWAPLPGTAAHWLSKHSTSGVHIGKLHTGVKYIALI